MRMLPLLRPRSNLSGSVHCGLEFADKEDRKPVASFVPSLQVQSETSEARELARIEALGDPIFRSGRLAQRAAPQRQ